MNRLKFLLLLPFSLFLLSCESTEDAKTSEAQACLDSARGGTEASACMSKVDGIESPAASRIRVGAVYMQRGFVTSSFVTAYNNLKTPPSGTDATVATFSYLAFTGTNSFRGNATPSQDADFVFAEAVKSGSGGLIWLTTGTKISALANITTVGDAAGLQAAINGLNNTDLGNLALQVNSSYCGGSSASTTAACKEFNSAITQGGSDPAAVGAALKALLNNTSN